MRIRDLLEEPTNKYLLFAEGDDGDGGGGDAGDDTGDGGDGSVVAQPVATNDDWRAPIKDDKLRDHAGRYTTLDSLVSNNLEMRQKLSSAIVKPGKDASDDDLSSWRKALGVPDSPDKYQFTIPEGYEPTETDIAFQKAAAEVFHKHDIPAEAAQGLASWWADFSAQVAEKQAEADRQYAADSEAALRIEWPGEEYNRNKAYANRAVAKIFGNDLESVRQIETKDGKFVLDHPAFVRMFAQYGREMAEGTLGEIMTENLSNDIQSQIDDLQTKMEKAQYSGDRERANAYYRQQQELYRRLYGAGPIVGSEGRAA